MWWDDPTQVPGSEKYEKWDVGWLKALEAYRQNSIKAPWPQDGIVVDIPDTCTICVAGDWGTGIPPATTLISSLISAENPDYTIHLGDEYYCGSLDEESLFVGTWPAGSKGSFCLNSNHAMYSGGWGYLQTLADSKFLAQGNKAYFALRNKQWLIVGLDSARYTDSFLYQQGEVNIAQLQWLASLNDGSRKIIIMTHHDPQNLDMLDQEGGQDIIIKKSLMDQVLAVVQPYRWYFGHVHQTIVYDGGYRCIGGSGLPFIPFNSHQATVKFIENTTVSNSKRSPTSFAVLRFYDSALTEQIVDETGQSRWTE